MKNLFTFCLPLLLCCACIGQGALEKEGPGGVPEPEVAHGMIVLGDRLEDPYSVENMSKALASLYPTKADRVVLPATDLYVRFLPADDLQLRLLRELGIDPSDDDLIRMAASCARATGGSRGSAKVLYEADFLNIYRMAM